MKKKSLRRYICKEQISREINDIEEKEKEKKLVSRDLRSE